jgi:glutamine amidotransferase
VLTNKKPILGICLGMQLMANSSTEDGLHDGFGFIPAKVTMFDKEKLKIPHVGFNQVEFFDTSKLYRDLENRSDFYFTHSYHMSSNNDIHQAVCDYGRKFIVSYELDNIAGVQFHPELSQTNGLKLLDNFIKNF